MKIKNKQSGLTVIELLVVIGIIAAVVAISLPAINAMQKSFDSTGAEGMISAALSTARTLAISRQQYVGVRFQYSYDVSDKSQYMIFIAPSESASTLTDEFYAIDGYKPMKLPVNMGVVEVGEPNFIDAEKFSIVFSPAGKLVVHMVQTKHKNDNDVVFNVEANLDNGIGQFLKDGSYEDEKSKNSLVIYNRSEFEKLPDADKSDYIDNLPELYINPYTGGIIEKD